MFLFTTYADFNEAYVMLRFKIKAQAWLTGVVTPNSSMLTPV